MIGAWLVHDRDACRPPLQAAGGGGGVAQKQENKERGGRYGGWTRRGWRVPVLMKEEPMDGASKETSEPIPRVK